jgi:fibro-slime domain-containing protein
VQRRLSAGSVGCLFWSLLAASCGSRTELVVAQICNVEGQERACSTGCGSGAQLCSGGFWQPCDVPVVTRACSTECGAGQQSCVDGAWQTICETPPVQRDCSSVCGPGHESCVDGKWGPCDAPRPKPPQLKATVRDFSPLTHPDFEAHYPAGLDLGIVEFRLGPDDTPVYNGMPRTPSTSGAFNFNQWYHDAPNNASAPLELKLTPSADQPDLFEYSNDFFFPIDNQLLGNEGRPHNYHFTLQASTTFEYRGGELFSFAGDDDMWVFVNRRLAINLGGTHQRASADIQLDTIATRFELSIGNVYPLHFFFAERHTVSSTFTLRTTIAEPGSCN